MNGRRHGDEARRGFGGRALMGYYGCSYTIESRHARQATTRAQRLPDRKQRTEYRP